MWFIGVEVEQETSAPPPKKNPGSAPVTSISLQIFRVVQQSRGKDQVCASCTAAVRVLP